MKIKQTIKYSVIGLIVSVGAFIILPTTAYAATCGGVETSVLSCNETGAGSGSCPGGSTVSKDQIKAGTKCPDGSEPQVLANTGVWGILLVAVNILTAGIGVAAVAGVVYGSVLYTSAGGSADQIKKASEVFTNVVIGVIAYALMYAAINFLVPGGLFNG